MLRTVAGTLSAMIDTTSDLMSRIERKLILLQWMAAVQLILTLTLLVMT